MTLSPERKKQIEDEEKAKFTAQQETRDEADYRAKVKADLESGGFLGAMKKQAGKFLKDVTKGC